MASQDTESLPAKKPKAKRQCHFNPSGPKSLGELLRAREVRIYIATS